MLMCSVFALTDREPVTSRAGILPRSRGNVRRELPLLLRCIRREVGEDISEPGKLQTSPGPYLGNVQDIDATQGCF